MTDLDNAWQRLEQLANGSPREQAEAEAIIAEAERLTDLARQLTRPRAVSPARARMQRYPTTPKAAKANRLN